MPRGTRRKQARLAVVEEDTSLSEVREFASGLKETFLHCRTLGHNWQAYAAGSHQDGGWDSTLRCSRCKTKREQVLSNSGMVLSSRYVHPEGYLHVGMGRIYGEGRGLLRLETVTRLLAKTANTAEEATPRGA